MRAPAIAHDDARALFVRVSGQPHHGARRRITHRVHDDIADRPAAHDCVCEHFAVGVDFERDAAFIGDAFEVRADGFQLLAYIEPLALDALLPMIRLREKQNVLRDAREPLQFLQIRFEHAAIFRDAALMCERDLRLADQHADRRAQLMREIRGELQQAFVAVFETIEHRVERCREALQFGGRMRDIEPRGQAGSA